MTTSIQLVMGVFGVAGYAIGLLHSWLASPVGAAELKALEAVVAHSRALQAHARLQALAKGAIAVAHKIPVIDDALHKLATGAPPAPPYSPAP